jgi:hypothetical protein
MKKLFLIIISFTALSYAQFRDPAFPETTVKDGIISSNSSSLFGFLNSENFSMNHSYNLSYSAFGGEGLALSMYTNSMFYNFADNLNVQLDASIMHSPYSTLGKDFENNLSGIYISRAAVNYKPWKNVAVSLQYRQLPFSYYNPYGYYGGGMYNSFYNGFFNDDDPFKR